MNFFASYGATTWLKIETECQYGILTPKPIKNKPNKAINIEELRRSSADPRIAKSYELIKIFL